MAIWILTRKQKPSDTEMADILTTVDAVLETNQLDQFEFRLTNPKCESVVKTNSKEGKLDNEDPTTDPPTSSTNTPLTLQTNSDGYPGISSNSSNNTNSNEHNKSKLNTPLALSEVNDNKTPGQKPNNPSPTTESLLKQNPTNNSFTNNGLSKTLNSSFDRMSSNNGKEKTDKNVLYSVLQNLLTQKPKNNSTDNSIDNLPNEDDKLSRRDRKRKLSKRKPRTFESEQNKLHSLPENPLAETPIQDSYSNNGLSGGHSLSESIAHNLPTGQEEPAEGFFPSLARQAFFKYIPKAFNFDFWRI